MVMELGTVRMVGEQSSETEEEELTHALPTPQIVGHP